MRNMSKAKRIALIVSLFIAVVGISFGGTYALLTARSAGLENKFEVGSVETKIYEPDMMMVGKKVSKQPSILNVGENDCYVRARVEISPADAGIELEGVDTANWEKKGEFYYYKSVVTANTGTVTDKTTPIFTSVKLPESWVSGEGENAVATDDFQDFDVIVYQEAVQANLVINGENTTERDRIWEAYDNYQAEITR